MADHKLLISANDLTFEVSGPEEWVKKKEKEYSDFIQQITGGTKDGNLPPRKKAEANTNPTGEFSTKLTVNEFYRKYIQAQKVSSRPDIATFLIFYLTRTAGKKEFSANEVKEQFKNIGYPAWNQININDVLNKAKQKALLNSVNNLWSLSITGEDMVLNSLTDNGKGGK